LQISVDLGENDFDPMTFVEATQFAEKLGFTRLWIGDHFMPWIDSGDRSSFAWSVVPVCLDRTSKVQLSPYVTVPIGARYHPAIIAQAIATIDNMYPGRTILCVGSGEAMNESNFLPKGWPTWDERMDRLVEGIQLIRNLFEKTEYFDFHGKYFNMKKVRLFTKPRTKQRIFVSAIGPKAAYLAGKYGDGLITLSSNNSMERFEDKILPAFDKGQREAGKDPARAEKIISLFYTFEDKDKYVKSVKETGSMPHVPKDAWNEPDPRKLQENSRNMSVEQMINSTFFCKNWDDVADIIDRFGHMGFTGTAMFTGANKDSISEVAKNMSNRFQK
jgi:coenzyme F420-dependent glucose-6-phosphate dehydrogenase